MEKLFNCINKLFVLLQISVLIAWLVIATLFMIVAPIASELYEARMFKRDKTFLAKTPSLNSATLSQDHSQSSLKRHSNVEIKDGDSEMTSRHSIPRERSRKRIAFAREPTK